MPILKSAKPRHDGADCPYPSWDLVADTVGLQRKRDAQDRRAEKETRLWRELAGEPCSIDIDAKPHH